MERNVLSLLVANHFGVLTRVTNLFGQRGFNIDSLAVGETGIFFAEVMAWAGADIILVISYRKTIREVSRFQRKESAFPDRTGR